MPKLAVADTDQLVTLLADIESDPVELTDGPDIVAVLVGRGYLDALHATQALLATTGSLAAVEEGLADLQAGRADDWRRLRTDYGRGDPDQVALLDIADAPVLASHRARWDLDLLVPAVAERCFDLLDGWQPVSSGSFGYALTAGFPELSMVVQDGLRLVHRVTAEGQLQAVHVSAVPS